jgi:hypothetical protein
MSNVFMTTPCTGLVVEDATLADWLAAGGSPLLGATLVPMEDKWPMAQPVTLREVDHG